MVKLGVIGRNFVAEGEIDPVPWNEASLITMEGSLRND